MSKITYIDEVNPNCPIRNILTHISIKWSHVVIYTLSKEERSMQFSALQRENPDTSQKVLTSTLRTLENDGLVKWKRYSWTEIKTSGRNSRCSETV